MSYRPRFSNLELRDALLQLGYDVPMMVIESWGLTTRNRSAVERWLCKELRVPGVHNCAFPNWLLTFRIKKAG
jgi:hypothetical protein